MTAPFLKSLFSLAHDMSAVQRFSRIRMVHPENVLQHTGMVCVFSYFIGSRLIEMQHRLDADLIDIGRIMRCAVVHDMDETITGDIVRPTKYFSEAIRKELGELERRGVVNVSQALNYKPLVSDFLDAKKYREGFVVKLADFLAVVCTAYIEVEVCGNLAMSKVAGVSLLQDFEREAKRLFDREKQAAFLLDLILEAADLLTAIRGEINPLPSIHDASGF